MDLDKTTNILHGNAQGSPFGSRVGGNAGSGDDLIVTIFDGETCL